MLVKGVTGIDVTLWHPSHLHCHSLTPHCEHMEAETWPPISRWPFHTYFYTLIHVSLKFIPWGPINNKTSLMHLSITWPQCFLLIDGSLYAALSFAPKCIDILLYKWITIYNLQEPLTVITSATVVIKSLQMSAVMVLTLYRIFT